MTVFCARAGTGPALLLLHGIGSNSRSFRHQLADLSDAYSVIATVSTFPGAKTISVDPMTHNVYLFQPERGPVPADAPPPAPGSRGPRGPVIASWFIVIRP